MRHWPSGFGFTAVFGQSERGLLKMSFVPFELPIFER